MTRRRTPLLILGLGNVLCGDDGVGIAAVSRLQREYRAKGDVEVLDGGTLGLALLPILMDAEQVILVDAVRTGDPPGTPVNLEGSDVLRAARERLSPHQIGVADLLDGAILRDAYPDRVLLVGIVPGSIELGVSLTPVVEAGLPELVERVAAAAAALGFPLTRREDPAPAFRRPAAGVSAAPALLGM
jgi:hydrogenase maturation protease